jgi:hypothetical protein
MDVPPMPLSPAQHRVLVDLTERYAPHLTALARDAVNRRWLTQDECDALGGLMLAISLEHLGPGGEPEGEGREADLLAGRLAMQAREFWTRPPEDEPTT